MKYVLISVGCENHSFALCYINLITVHAVTLITYDPRLHKMFPLYIYICYLKILRPLNSS